jgi:hypothetical protein
LEKLLSGGSSVPSSNHYIAPPAAKWSAPWPSMTNPRGANGVGANAAPADASRTHPKACKDPWKQGKKSLQGGSFHRLSYGIIIVGRRF